MGTQTLRQYAGGVGETHFLRVFYKKKSNPTAERPSFLVQNHSI